MKQTRLNQNRFGIWGNKVVTFFSKPYNVILLLFGIPAESAAIPQ